jgi:hypothetical protein
MAIPTPNKTVAYIAITLFDDGNMAVSGNIGDVKMALQMIDGARDAVKNQLNHRTAEGLLLPSRDVEASPHPAFPLIPHGDVEDSLHPKLLTEVKT